MVGISLRLHNPPHPSGINKIVDEIGSQEATQETNIMVTSDDGGHGHFLFFLGMDVHFGS